MSRPKRRSTSSSPESVVAKRRHVDDEDENKENAATAAALDDSDHRIESSPEKDEEAYEEDAVKEDDEEEEGDMDDEEEEDLTTSEALGRRRKSNSSPMGSGKPAEAGIIKQIYCENFMCHRKLTVDLNRNVNFIHGQNGSGKSAILAAIQICLGAGARRTHRARNIKELVRKDAGGSNSTPSCAKVRVTLLNHGTDGYKHEVYGDTITVERTIAVRGGYNGYKLLDHSGKEQSRSKKDLDEMLDTLNIQVENPVAVLDQEEAKKFLMGKPEDKYAFFMKATELERVDRTYSSTMDTVAELTETNYRVKESLQAAEDNVEMLKKKWQEHQAVGKLETKQQKLTTEWAWAYYGQINEEYHSAVQDMEAFEEKAAKKQEELTQAEAASTQNGDTEEKREKIDELLAECQNQLALKRDLEDELKAATAPYKNVERQLAQLKKRQNAAAKMLATAKQRLQKARDEIMASADSAQSEEARRTETLRQTEEDLAAARQKVASLKQDMSTWLRKYEELEPHVQDATSKCDAVKQKLRGVESTIQRLNSSAGDSMEILGPRVAKVAKLIQQARRQNKFRGNVLGPIGSFIKIVPGKEEFASVAEFALGGNMLDRFIVTNDHDAAVLREIRQKAGCQQDCGFFQLEPAARYRIPPPPEVDGIETIASVLTIDDALVFNCLVDNGRIDQRALARSKEFSEEQLLVKKGKDQYAMRAQNIKEVFCLPRGDMWTLKGNMHALYSNDRGLRQTIGVDRSAAVAEAERDRATLKEELQQLTQEENKLQHEHSEAQKAWNRAKKAVQKNDTAIDDLTAKISAIKEEMENSENVTIDTTEYEEDVQQAEEACEQLKGTEHTLQAELEESRPKIDDIKTRLDECTVRNQKVQEDMRAAETELTQAMESQSQIQDQIAKKRQKLEKLEQILSKHREKIEMTAEAREKALVKARKVYFRYLQRKRAEEEGENDGASQEEVCTDPTEEELEAIEPIEVEHDPKYYEVRLAKNKEKIAKEREKRKVSREDPSVAYEKYKRAMNDFRAKADSFKKTEATIQELQSDMKERQKRWKQFRRHLSRKTGDTFDRFLTMNNYSGQLGFEHESKQLELSVQKNSGAAQSETKDVKALSGGERSYTTMCLLLALGEELETPFRILDEFDVFLDAEVRKLTIKSLIHVAKNMNHRQFIFITPQDLSSITPDSQLKILKLNPPSRHQNAGGLSQQTLNFASQG